MMTVHSIKIRTRWNSATTAKITPATKENVFASISHHPKFLTQDSTQAGGGCERRADDLGTVAKVTTGRAELVAGSVRIAARASKFSQASNTF